MALVIQYNILQYFMILQGAHCIIICNILQINEIVILSFKKENKNPTKYKYELKLYFIWSVPVTSNISELLHSLNNTFYSVKDAFSILQ